MKLRAQVGEESHEIEITRDGMRVYADVDGRKYELDASEPEPGVFLLKHGGKIHEAYVSAGGPDDPVSVVTGGAAFEIKVIDAKRLRGSSAGGEHTGGHAEIKTAMPGKVVRILAAEGDPVVKGDGVIVVEAMKMQNEMKAPKDGTISQIKVAEGDTVGAGDVLVVVE